MTTYSICMAPQHTMLYRAIRLGLQWGPEMQFLSDMLDLNEQFKRYEQEH